MILKKIRHLKRQVKETMQNNTNITLTLKRPNKYLTFLLPLKVKARFSNDLATIFNDTLYKSIIISFIKKGIKTVLSRDEAVKLYKNVIFTYL